MNTETEALIRQLRDIYAALHAFIILDNQARGWENEPEMENCLPDLYRRRGLAASAYVKFNGRSEPVIPHDRITLEKVEDVTRLLELGITDNVDDALRLLG